MKKLLFLTLLIVGTTVYADDYKYLTMGYNNMEKSIVLETIQKITFENNQVVVTTSDGKETFELAQMQRMFFSDTATAVKSIDNEEAIDNERKGIYDLTGRRVSTSSPHHSTASSLQKGIYIVNGKKVVFK